ncbi:hypothetical protein EJB05_21802, partial [Eragrostis curvula]
MGTPSRHSSSAVVIRSLISRGGVQFDELWVRRLQESLDQRYSRLGSTDVTSSGRGELVGDSRPNGGSRGGARAGGFLPYGSNHRGGYGGSDGGCYNGEEVAALPVVSEGTALQVFDETPFGNVIWDDEDVFDEMPVKDHTTGQTGKTALKAPLPLECVAQENKSSLFLEHDGDDADQMSEGAFEYSIAGANEIFNEAHRKILKEELHKVVLHSPFSQAYESSCAKANLAQGNDKDSGVQSFSFWLRKCQHGAMMSLFQDHVSTKLDYKAVVRVPGRGSRMRNISTLIQFVLKFRDVFYLHIVYPAERKKYLDQANKGTLAISEECGQHKDIKAVVKAHFMILFYTLLMIRLCTWLSSLLRPWDPGVPELVLCHAHKHQIPLPIIVAVVKWRLLRRSSGGGITFPDLRQAIKISCGGPFGPLLISVFLIAPIMACRESKKTGAEKKGPNGWIGCYLIEESKVKSLCCGYKEKHSINVIMYLCQQLQVHMLLPVKLI